MSAEECQFAHGAYDLRSTAGHPSSWRHAHINPPLGEGKNGRGGSKNLTFLFFGDDTIPGDGRVKKLSPTPPPPFFRRSKYQKY